jgi:hypothetical protein
VVPQAINAIADPGFVFAGWVATPADKAAFEDAALASTNVILSAYASVAGLHVASGGLYTMACDLPSGGTEIRLRRNTIAARSDGATVDTQGYY